MSTPRIVIIDDNELNRNELLDSLNSFEKKPFDLAIEAWDSNQIQKKMNDVKNKNEQESNAEEDMFSRLLEAENDILMIVVDRDLSNFECKISESSITTACLERSIPVCNYHRRPSRQPVHENLKQIVRQSNSYSVKINISEIKEATRKIFNVASGFQEIFTKIEKLNVKELMSPSQVLAAIIGLKNLSIYFDEYAQSSSLANFIFEYFDLISGNNKEINKRRIGYILGCWLHNHILLFPGVILNRVATYSYIDLKKESFEKCKSEFDESKYHGPFGKYEEYWIKNSLDNQLDEIKDPVEYFKNKLNDKNLDYCYCHVDDKERAGYFDIIEGKPISLLNSNGNLSWIPEGAILCRVGKNAYENAAPLLGM